MRENFQDLIVTMEGHLQDMEEAILDIVLGLCNMVVEEEEEAEEALDITEEVVVDTTIDMNKTTVDMIVMTEVALLHLIEWIDKVIEVVKGLIHLNLRKIIGARLEVIVDLLHVEVAQLEEKEEAKWLEAAQDNETHLVDMDRDMQEETELIKMKIEVQGIMEDKLEEIRPQLAQKTKHQREEVHIIEAQAILEAQLTQ